MNWDPRLTMLSRRFLRVVAVRASGRSSVPPRCRYRSRRARAVEVVTGYLVVRIEFEDLPVEGFGTRSVAAFPQAPSKPCICDCSSRRHVDEPAIYGLS